MAFFQLTRVLGSFMAWKWRMNFALTTTSKKTWGKMKKTLKSNLFKNIHIRIKVRIGSMKRSIGRLSNGVDFYARQRPERFKF